MSQLTITKEIKRNGITIDIVVDVTEDLVTVYTPAGQEELLWDQLEDVEMLSNIFAEIPVYLFKVLVQTLGQVYNNRNAYKDVA